MLLAQAFLIADTKLVLVRGSVTFSSKTVQANRYLAVRRTVLMFYLLSK